MSLTFAALESDIAKMISAAKITNSAAARKQAQRLLVNKDRFLSVQQMTGVPAIWLMPVFYRENPSFDAYFGNGDPIDRPTTDVPAGRGPFATWEDGVVDSLTIDHIIAVQSWSWTRACYQWESWNGFGPRLHGRSTGYVWSWTDQYHGGKYVADGVWSRGTWDQQGGCFAIAKAIVSLDPSMETGLNEAQA